MEQEISHTRERIGRTVQALEQRLSPGQLVDQALGYARDHGGHFASNVASSVRRNPLPLLVTGIGVIWMLRSQSSSARDSRRLLESPYEYNGGESAFGDATTAWEDGSAYDSGGSAAGRSRVADRLSGAGDSIKSRAAGARDGVSAAAGSVGDTMRSAKDSLVGRTGGALDSARATSGRVRERVRGASHNARDQAYRARDEFSTLMDEQPLLMGAIGVAIGATIAALVPATRRERQVMGKVSDEVAGKAEDLAAQGYENLREAASSSVNEFTRSLAKGSDSDRTEEVRPDSAGRSAAGQQDSKQSTSPYGTPASSAGPAI